MPRIPAPPSCKHFTSIAKSTTVQSSLSLSSLFHSYRTMPPFEPALSEDLSDTHLSSLLIADARASSQKYASQGLSAFLGRKSAPKIKPNTRFLANLVKNADGHNERLRRKEDTERKAKLQKLEEMERRREMESEGRLKGTGEETMDGEAESRPRKRRKTLDDEDNEDHPHHKSSKHRSRGRDKERRRHKHRHNTSSAEENEKNRSQSRSPSKTERRQRKHDSKYRSKDHRKHKRRRSSPDRDNASDSLQNDSESTLRAKSSSRSKHEEDPLNIPKLASTRNSASTPQPTTKRKSSTKRNTSPQDKDEAEAGNDGGNDDWTSALSALRDRANRQRIQASRRITSGATTDTTSTSTTKREKSSNGSLTNGNMNDNVNDIKWSKKGQEREWDRGKEVEQEGS